MVIQTEMACLMKQRDKQLSIEDASASRLGTKVITIALMFKTVLIKKFFSHSAHVKF